MIDEDWNGPDWDDDFWDFDSTDVNNPWDEEMHLIVSIVALKLLNYISLEEWSCED